MGLFSPRKIKFHWPSLLWLFCLGLLLTVSPQSLTAKHPKQVLIPMPLQQVSVTQLTSKKTITLSLSEVVYLALSKSPDIESAEIQRVSDKYTLLLAQYPFQLQYALGASATYTQTKSAGERANNQTYQLSPAPQVSLNTSLGTSYTITGAQTTSNPGGAGPGLPNTTYSPSVQMQITQPLLRGFGKDVNANYISLLNARDQEQLNRLALKNSIISAIRAVIDDYWNLVSVKQSLVIAKNSLKTSTEQAAINKKKIKAGQLAPADNLNTETQIATQQLSIERNKNSMIQAQRQLALDIGLQAGVLVDVPEKVILPKITLPTLADSVALALKNSLSYQSSLLAIKTTERSLRQALDQQRWQLDLTGNLTVGSGSGLGPDGELQSLVNGRNYNRSINLALTIPLDDLNTKASISSNKISLQQAKLAFDTTKRTVENSVNDSLVTLNFDKTSIKLAEDSLRLSKQVLDNARIKYNAGQSTSFELTTEQDNYDNAQQTLLSARITYAKDLTAFQQLIGATLDDWDIQLRY